MSRVCIPGLTARVRPLAIALLAAVALGSGAHAATPAERNVAAVRAHPGFKAAAAALTADHDRIVAETERLLDDPAEYDRMARAHNPFGDGHATERIVELLAAA